MCSSRTCTGILYGLITKRTYYLSDDMCCYCKTLNRVFIYCNTRAKANMLKLTHSDSIRTIRYWFSAKQCFHVSVSKATYFNWVIFIEELTKLWINNHLYWLNVWPILRIIPTPVSLVWERRCYEWLEIFYFFLIFFGIIREVFC